MLVITKNIKQMTVGDAINIAEQSGNNDLLPSWYFGVKIDTLMMKAHHTPLVDENVISIEEQYANIENGHIKSIQAKVKKNGTEIEFYTGEAITGGVAS